MEYFILNNKRKSKSIINYLITSDSLPKIHRRLNIYAEDDAFQIEILDNKINLTPLSKDIVLKFNYFPFLKTNNCKISNESVSESINFIKLSDCDIGKATTIKDYRRIK